jgi:hypothetical protein
MVTGMARKERDRFECNWCAHCDVDVNGGRPEISCDVATDVKKGTLYSRPYTRKHAYPMEDAERASDSWEDWNQEADCPYFSLLEDDFGFTCPACSGSGEGMADGTTCRSCGGSGEDIKLPRDLFPWD